MFAVADLRMGEYKAIAIIVDEIEKYAKNKRVKMIEATAVAHQRMKTE